MKSFTTSLCALAACVAVALELPNGRIVRTVETNGVTAVYFELTPEPTSFIRGVVALPPVEKWNGRLKGLGGGGPANYLNDKGPINAAMQGWAAVYSDLGSSRGVSTPAQIRDYGHRATHLACTTAKALVQEKYGKPAHHAYFVGGSTGGGQGFHEVLRYPDDYDGVISMVPANTRLPLHVYFAWNLRLMTDAAGKSIFSDAELAAVEEAAIDVFRDKDEPWARGRFLTDSRYDPETEKAIVARAIARAPSLNRPDLLDRLHKLFTGPVLDGKRIHAGVPFSGSFRKAAGNQWMLQWFLGPDRALHTVTDEELADSVDCIRKGAEDYARRRQLQYEYMDRHEQIADGVFRTAYSDGSSTICNYTDKSVRMNGRDVPPVSYVLVPGGGSRPHSSFANSNRFTQERKQK